MTLRTRVLLLVVLAIIPVIGIEIFSEIRLRAAREQQIDDEAMRLMRLTAAEMGRIGEGARQMLIAFSEDAAIRDGDWPTCNAAAARIHQQVEGYVNIGVANLAGTVVCSYLPSPPGLLIRDGPAFAAVDAHEDFAVGIYQIGRIAQRRILTYSIPWRDATGTVRGAIWAAVDLDWLAHHFSDRFHSTDLTLLIADAEGTILVRLPDDKKWVGKPMGAQYQDVLTAATVGVKQIVGIDGAHRIVAYSPLSQDPVGLYIGVGLSEGPFFAQINAATRQKLFLISFAFSLALLAAWLGGSAFVRRPVERLLETTQRWQAGDLSARNNFTDTASELGKLGAAFDHLAETLERRQGERQHAEEALARLNLDLERRVESEVTERELAQTALVQAQKLEAVGQLTSGVAHDFNNLLTAIVGNLEMLARREPKDEQSARLIAAAQRAADRGAKLTQQLLAFSRKQRMATEPIDLNRIVSGMIGLLHSTIGKTVRIETVLGNALWLALADGSQVELVILNLVINARDAMTLGGAITIETANVTVTSRNSAEEPPPGEYVMMSVADTGPGIAPEILPRVFEPFFTTKEVGKGSGLGLPQVLGVAQQLGGGVRIESRTGEGTCVKVFLPRSAIGETAVPGGVAQPAHRVRAPRARTGVVLLIDDDSEVRSLTAAMLREFGNEVIEAGSGGAGVERLERENARIELVIIDFAMPGMNGVEVARVVRRNWPRIPILFITGFADTAMLAAEATAEDIIQKPYRGLDLAAKVSAAISKGATPKILPFPTPGTAAPSGA